ncbi:MAG TPA: TonB family protein [Terriglobales bacterium]|nr:TonB family protein [Terriglobales bacterium]
MAHLPTLPDPTPRRSPHGQHPSGSSDSQFSSTKLSQILGEHGVGPGSEGLALDLLLHEIVSQACSTTNAAGAAIALLHDGEFVCRATSGKHAPDLGSQLSTDSGLSGASIHTGVVQRCDDTEVDTRVDTAACRRLGVRSVVVVPLLQADKVTGILEVFSPHAQVFTDGDVETLRALSCQIVETITHPAGKEEEETTSQSEPANTYESASPSRDPWTIVLAVLIVLVALLLGWMLGHRNKAATGRDTSAAISAKPVGATIETPLSTPISTQPSNQTLPPATTAKAPVQASGGLVVYENGKPVFQVKPTTVRPPAIAAQLPTHAVNSLLLERVEPQYPDAARLAHIQGPVVLDVNVNEKGAVEEIRTLSGDPQLATAAVEAVKQWRFKPYAPRGEALNFQTQVTVDFKLP